MQIGIGDAACAIWDGAAIHSASQVVSGVATNEDGDGIAGAARYLLGFQVRTYPSGGNLRSYNHLQSYVRSVLCHAVQYAGGGTPWRPRRPRGALTEPVVAHPESAVDDVTCRLKSGRSTVRSCP